MMQVVQVRSVVGGYGGVVLACQTCTARQGAGAAVRIEVIQQQYPVRSQKTAL